MFSPLETEFIPPNMWRLSLPMVWRPGTSDQITVPEGFVTDLDSVPRIPLVYAKYKGRTTKAAVLHDYLCHRHDYGWAEAANIFLEAMKDEGVAWRIRYTIYIAVRAYGLARLKRGAWS